MTITQTMTVPETTKVLYDLARKHGLDLDASEQEYVRLNIGWTPREGGIMDLVIETQGALGPFVTAGNYGEVNGDAYIDNERHYYRTPDGLVPARIIVMGGMFDRRLTERRDDGTFRVVDAEGFEIEIQEDAERARMWAGRYGDATRVR